MRNGMTARERVTWKAMKSRIERTALTLSELKYESDGRREEIEYP